MKNRTMHGKPIYLLLLLLLVGPFYSLWIYAAPLTGELSTSVLQESISIVEIDREIERIHLEQAHLKQEHAELTTQIKTEQQQLKLQRKHTGAILRSYYIGDRDKLLSALLGVRNLQQFLRLYDYYQLMIGHDQEVLQDYEQQYRTLRQTRQQTENKALELSNVQAKLLEQRERVQALQQSVKEKIQNSQRPDTLRQIIAEMISYWENVGIYEVNRHFKALADAMQHLPQFIEGQSNAIVTNGREYTVTIRESEFNQFLQLENKLFQHFRFSFEKDHISVAGQQGNMTLQIQGHYTVENKPQNSLLFHMDQLVFNGLELPDTTRKNVENRFDLGFYPQKILPYMRATDVKLSPGILQVKLELHF